LLSGISSKSDEVDEDVEREAGFDLESEEILDSILTISATVCRESVLPLGAYEATDFEQPASS